MKDALQNIANIPYLETLFKDWQQVKSSVDPQWSDFFERLDERLDEAQPGDTHQKTDRSADMVYKQSRVDSLLWAYRDVGYLYAKLNPLGEYLISEQNTYEELSPKSFGLAEQDLELEFSAGRALQPSRASLRAILQAYRETYCSYIGVEFLHIQNKNVRRWLIEKMESTRNHPELDKEKGLIILEDLIEAEEFEHFLHTTFIGQKRFSLEGAEVVIPALHSLVDSAHDRGVSDIVIGMTHRGRLTVLNRILNKPLSDIFSEFQDHSTPGMYGGSGDVKYHLGYSLDHKHPDGSSVHVTLVANPSHLESVDPIVEGKTRAVQDRRGDISRQRVIPVILHGDAAFSGQGVVSEVLNLSQLNGYHTGGTIHIIINNQIGFTTSTRDARSTYFPTDVAKAMAVPIFHVNGDHPDEVVYVMDLALQFRQEFGKDVVVDIFCYRLHGHNEGDEPSFTHPRMYKLIKKHPSVAKLYSEICINRNIVSEQQIQGMRKEFKTSLKKSLKKESHSPQQPDAFKGGDWIGIQSGYSHEPCITGIARDDLIRIAKKVNKIPDDFHIHAKLERIIGDKMQRLSRDGLIDWAFAETLSFGSLLLEGSTVRLSGQDSARGTFSQRHSVWWDTESEEPRSYVPLNNLSKDQARFDVFDSPLSEYSVLGFEYGYALSRPLALVIWEAQFGDFCNGAQVIIDNYIVSAESKWFRANGLVILLPHGYEGQGPEHSSAHLERFLQSCAEDNVQVCVPTTPAQYFHLLRRQMKRKFRKPLIVFAPKSLLRHPRAVSSIESLSGESFQEVMSDEGSVKDVRRLLLCSGKVYYDLLQKREELEKKDIALIRIEQLYPFPIKNLRALLGTYSPTDEVFWIQEEPRNRGAWTYMKQMFAGHFPSIRLQYIGRLESASPATGSYRQHIREQTAIMESAFAAVVSGEKASVA